MSDTGYDETLWLNFPSLCDSWGVTTGTAASSLESAEVAPGVILEGALILWDAVTYGPDLLGANIGSPAGAGRSRPARYCGPALLEPSAWSAVKSTGSAPIRGVEASASQASEGHVRGTAVVSMEPLTDAQVRHANLSPILGGRGVWHASPARLSASQLYVKRKVANALAEQRGWPRVETLEPTKPGSLLHAVAELVNGTSDRHAPELMLALEAWHACRPGGSFAKGRSRKKARQVLLDWLEARQPVGGKPMKKSAVDRIATVANWDKTRGPLASK